MHKLLRKVRLKKAMDTVFNGSHHPNGINVGYEREGWIFEVPKIGERFVLWPNKLNRLGDLYGSFHTSNVRVFQVGRIITQNSIYLAEYESSLDDGTVIWLDLDVNKLAEEVANSDK